MPKVPVYQQSVQSQGIPGARVNVDAPDAAFGVGSSKPILEAGAAAVEAGKVFQQEKEKADDLATTEAWAKAVKKKNERLYDPTNGAISRKGKNAFGVVDEFGKSYNSDLDEIEKGLNTESQRQMFRKIRVKEHSELDGQLQRHLFSEAKAYDEETTKGGISAALDDAVNNYHEPGKVEASIKMQESLRVASAQRNGLPADATKMLIENDRSKTHKAVIDRMLANGQDMAAKTYYEKAKSQPGNILGSDASDIERSLQEGASRGESQRQADSIWMSSKGNLTAALAEARKIEDPKIQDLTKQRIKERANEDEAGKKFSQDRAYEQAVKLIGDRSGAAARINIPPALWNSLSPEQQSAVQRRAEDVPNNSKVWLNFLALDAKTVGSMSQSDFESKYWQHLDKEHRAKAETQWNAARDAKINPKKDEQFKSIKSDKEMIFDAIKQSGVFDATDTMSSVAKDDDKAALYDQAENEIEAAFEAYYNQNGKNPDDKEKRRIIGDKLKKKVFIERTFWRDPARPAGMVKDDEKGSAYVPLEEIPATEQAAIKNILKSKGKKVTEDKIQKAYAAYLMKDRALYLQILEGK